MTHTQWCVLTVLSEHGGLWRWSSIAKEIRQRSERTVRPTTATMKSLESGGFARRTILGVTLTQRGREALAASR